MAGRARARGPREPRPAVLLTQLGQPAVTDDVVPPAEFLVLLEVGEKAQDRTGDKPGRPAPSPPRPSPPLSASSCHL